MKAIKYTLITILVVVVMFGVVGDFIISTSTSTSNPIKQTIMSKKTKIRTGSDYLLEFRSLHEQQTSLRIRLINDVRRLATTYPDAIITHIDKTPIKAKPLIDQYMDENTFSNNRLIMYLDIIQKHADSLNNRRQLDIFDDSVK